MDSKRLIIAIVFSAAILFLWAKFFSPKPKKPEPVKSATETQEMTENKTAVPETTSFNTTSIKPAAAGISESTIDMETNRFKITLSNRGGSIVRYFYKDRNVELAVPNEKYNASGNFNFSLYFSESEFMNGNSLETALWNYTQSGNDVAFYTDITFNGNNVRLLKTYSFLPDENFFRVAVELLNTGKAPVSLPNNYLIVSPSDFLGPEMDLENRYNNISQVFYLNGDFKKVQKGGGFFSKGENIKRETGDIKWSGIMNRYFVLVMLFEDGSGSGVICDNRKTSGYKPGVFISNSGIQPGDKFRKSFKVYTGEKNKEKLTAVDPVLRDAADVSKWIEPIKDFVLWCILKINLLVGNYGWSIVIFAILSKFVLMPLYLKTLKSQKRMQELTPKLNELKEKYKDKQEVYSKEMMKLYKANKVNPAGMCLPTLVQMPFLFALYSALLNSVEMWQAPFIFWIRDLSMPDTVFQIMGYNFNILPLIMVGTQLLQQKMTPMVAAGQQQKMMTYLMPLIFIFIFWSMPSGLVLYWTVQNIVQVFQQLITNKIKGKEEKA